MTNYYAPTVVQPAIPNELMTPIERWFLSHVFEHEPIHGMPYGEGTYFFAEENPQTTVEIGDANAFADLLGASQDLSPELCAALGKQYDADADDIDVDAAGGVEWVLQHIVARSAGRLKYVTVESAFTASKMVPDGYGGCVTLITATDITGTSTHQWLTEQLKEQGLA